MDSNRVPQKLVLCNMKNTDNKYYVDYRIAHFVCPPYGLTPKSARGWFQVVKSHDVSLFIMAELRDWMTFVLPGLLFDRVPYILFCVDFAISGIASLIDLYCHGTLVHIVGPQFRRSTQFLTLL